MKDHKDRTVEALKDVCLGEVFELEYVTYYYYSYPNGHFLFWSQGRYTFNKSHPYMLVSTRIELLLLLLYLIYVIYEENEIHIFLLSRVWPKNRAPRAKKGLRIGLLWLRRVSRIGLLGLRRVSWMRVKDRTRGYG